VTMLAQQHVEGKLMELILQIEKKQRDQKR
jgi:hypothetical protein